MANNKFADFVFRVGTNGHIITVNENESEAPKALAVKDEYIVAVGKYEDVQEYVGENTTTIELKDGQTLLPGFIEPHTHAVTVAFMNSFTTVISAGGNLTTYNDVKKVITERVAEAAQATPQEWGVFSGWDPELIPDLPELNAEKIDSEFCGGREPIPVVIMGQSGHIAWMNQAALDVPGYTNDNAPKGFERKGNRLTGKVFEDFLDVLKHMEPVPDPETLKTGIEKQWRKYASRGFTTATDLNYIQNVLTDTALSKIDEKSLPLRVALYYNGSSNSEVRSSCCLSIAALVPKHGSYTEDAPFNPPVNFHADPSKPSSMLWVAGVKLMADGSPHCGTMAVEESFLTNDLTETLGFPSIDYPRGQLMYTDEQLHTLVKHHHDEEKQIATHAHGERAIAQVLNVYKKVDPANTRRHRVEHLGLMKKDQIIQAGQQKVTLSFFVSQLYYYGKTFSEFIFGRERTDRWTPLNLAVKYGLRWTIHQDHPTFPGSPLPFINLKTAVTRTQKDDPDIVYGSQHRVTINEAIKACTIHAAWQLRIDQYLGSLEKGKLADLLVVDQNPLDDSTSLEEIKVVETFVAGRRLVWSS